MLLGTDVDLSPGHIVVDGDPAHPPKRAQSPRPIFGRCLLWSNGWMMLLEGGTPRRRQHCVRWGPSYPPRKGTAPNIFGPRLLWRNGWMDQDASYGSRPRSGDTVLDGDPASPKKEDNPSIFGPCLLWPNGRPYCYQLLNKYRPSYRISNFCWSNL